MGMHRSNQLSYYQFLICLSWPSHNEFSLVTFRSTGSTAVFRYLVAYDCPHGQRNMINSGKWMFNTPQMKHGPICKCLFHQADQQSRTWSKKKWRERLARIKLQATVSGLWCRDEAMGAVFLKLKQPNTSRLWKKRMLLFFVIKIIL